MSDQPRGVDCDVVRDLLPLWREGLVSPATHALVRDHLDGCSDCRAVAEGATQAGEAVVGAAKAAIAGPAQAPLPPFLPRLRRLVLRAVAALVALALLLGGAVVYVVYGPILGADLGAQGPTHLYPSVAAYVNAQLPQFPAAVRAGEALRLHITRHLTASTDLSVVAYWPRNDGTYVVAVVSPRPGVARARLDDPVAVGNLPERGARPNLRMGFEWSHWIAGGRLAEVFVFAPYVGPNASRPAPVDVAFRIDAVAPLPTNMTGRAYPATAGHPDAFRTIRSFRPVSVSFAVPASLYRSPAVQRIVQPRRWVMGRRWLEFDSVTVTPAGETVTGRVHLLPGDGYGTADIFGCPGVASGGCAFDMGAPSSGPGTHRFTIQFYGTPAVVPEPLRDLQLTVLGLDVQRTVPVTATVPWPLPRKGAVLARTDGAVLRLVSLGTRSVTVDLTSPPAAVPGRVPGLGPTGLRAWVIRHVFRSPTYEFSNGPLVTLPAGLSVRGAITASTASSRASPRAPSVTTFTWARPAVVRSQAHTITVRTNLAINLFVFPPGGGTPWPSP